MVCLGLAAALLLLWSLVWMVAAQVTTAISCSMSTCYMSNYNIKHVYILKLG